MAEQDPAPAKKSYSRDLAQTYYRFIWVHVFAMLMLYATNWAILATSTGDWLAIALFCGCALVSALGVVFENLKIKSSDLYLPKVHSVVVYTLLSIIAGGAGTGVYFHVEWHVALPEKARLAAVILGISMYAVYFLFCVMRITEARFLPDKLPGHEPDFGPLR